MPARPYPRWQRRHEAILRWLLLNPTRPLKDCARETGYSPSHVSRIFKSPDFQRHWQSARKIIEEEISRAAIARLSGGRGGA